MLEILSRCGGPAGIRTAGKRKLAAIAAKNAPRMGAILVAEIYTALEAQTVVVPGSAAAETVLPKLTESLKETLQQRKAIVMNVELMLDAHLISMPGVGIRTAARILLVVGDGSAFKSAGHLAAYAGIAPVTHRSGTSIRGEHPARSENRKLKRALLLSAFAAPHDLTSRAYYDSKRAEGKRNTTQPSSDSLDADATSCSPCSRTRRFTNRPQLTQLDRNHRDTPGTGNRQREQDLFHSCIIRIHRDRLRNSSTEKISPPTTQTFNQGCKTHTV